MYIAISFKVLLARNVLECIGVFAFQEKNHESNF